MDHLSYLLDLTCIVINLLPILLFIFWLIAQFYQSILILIQDIIISIQRLLHYLLFAAPHLPPIGGSAAIFWDLSLGFSWHY
jgi:hypothetical protein